MTQKEQVHGKRGPQPWGGCHAGTLNGEGRWRYCAEDGRYLLTLKVEFAGEEIVEDVDVVVCSRHKRMIEAAPDEWMLNSEETASGPNSHDDRPRIYRAPT